jgi:adenylylsulfate kinase-like enzyme
MISEELARCSREERQGRRSRERGRFVEVWVKCSLEECMRGDPKGHYRRAPVWGERTRPAVFTAGLVL